MSDQWEKATIGSDRTCVRAALKLLRTAPPGSTVERGDDAQPVLRRRRKTIAELQAHLVAKRASLIAAERG